MAAHVDERWRRAGPAAAGLRAGLVWPYIEGMATMTVKSTYALDVETARALAEMARRWGVSRSEALRRAIRAARRGPASGAPKALAALDALQRSIDLDTSSAARWEKRARAARRAASLRRQSK